MEFCAILQQWPSGVSEGDFGGVVPQGDVTFNRVAVRISSNEFQDIKVHPAFPVIKSGQTEDTYLNIVHNAAALFHYFQIWLVVFIKIDPGKVLLIRNHSSLSSKTEVDGLCGFCLQPVTIQQIKMAVSGSSLVR